MKLARNYNERCFLNIHLDFDLLDAPFPPSVFQKVHSGFVQARSQKFDWLKLDYYSRKLKRFQEEQQGFWPVRQHTLSAEQSMSIVLLCFSKRLRQNSDVQ